MVDTPEEPRDNDDITHGTTGLAALLGAHPSRPDVVFGTDPRTLATGLQALGADALAQADDAALLHAGAVLVDAGSADLAARCYAALEGREGAEALARLGLAWVSWSRGEADACADGLRAAASLDAAVSLLPEGTNLRGVKARSGALVVLAADNDDGEFDVERLGLAHPLSEAQREALTGLATALQGLEAPAVAGYQTIELDDDGARLMRETSPGKPLAATLTDDPRSVDDAVAILEPLCAGLAAAHERGVVHGAVRPELVTMAPGGPVLRGLGLAALLRPSLADAARGTVAPEVLAGGEASAESDAYSIAALFYRLVTGNDPVGAVIRPSMMSLDPRLDELLAQGLAADPKSRLDVAAFAKRAGQIASSDAPVQPVVAAASQPIVVPSDPNDMEAWGTVFSNRPSHAEAREALAAIESSAREQQQWDRVAFVLTLRARHCEVQQERIDALRDLVETYDARLGAPASALREAQHLIEEVGVAEQIELIDEVRRLAEVTGQWGPLAESLEIVAQRAPEAADQARLYTALGKVFAERLGAGDRALAAYEKSIGIEADEENLAAAVPLYRKSGAVAELTATLLNLADHQEGEARAQSLRDAASVLHDELGDVEGAFTTLQAALEHDPDHAESLSTAETFARELEDWDSLVDLLDKQAAASNDDAAIIEYRREAASIAAEHLGDSARAVAQLDKILDIDPAHAGTASRRVELLRPLAEQDVARRPTLIAAIGDMAAQAERPDEKVALWTEQASLLDAEPDGKAEAARVREQIVEALGFEHEAVRDAAEALERWYRREEQPEALRTLLRRAGESKDAETSVRVDAWSKVVELCKTAEDDDGALAALEALTALDSDHHGFRDQLLERYLAREDFAKAGPLIRQQVDDDSIDPKRKAALLWRGGQLREQIGKSEGAREALEEAVKLDPTLHDAWLALRDLYRQQDQPLKAIEAQVSAGRAHPSRAERASLIFDAATLYLNTLGQPDKGLSLLEELVELDPDHREATGMLVERLVADDDLARAWPVAQTWVSQVRAQARDDKALNVRALSIAGRCALAVDEPERAREYLAKARNADATNFDVLRLLGELDLGAERWEEALKSYQSVVLGGADKVPPAEMSQVYLKMAAARVGMGEVPKAVQLVERALDIDPENRAAIDTLVEMAEDAETRVKAKQRLAELLERREGTLEGEAKDAVQAERIGLLQEIAEIQGTELEAPQDAAGTLETILDLQPRDPAVLHALLNAFTKAGRWRDVTRVLDQLAAVQESDAMRAKYLYAGAAIFRDQLSDLDGFAEWAQRVLEADPMHAKAFRGVADNFERNSDWKGLAKHLRGRLKALPKDATAEDRVELFVSLGEVYETKLGDPKTAIAAYSQAVRFAPAGSDGDPQVRQRRTKIMDLAVSLGDDEIDKAIVQGHALISGDPMEFDTYHRLVELYDKRNNPDRSLSICRTLAFLKQANEKEQALVDAAAEQESQIRSVLTKEQWRKALYHPQQDPRLTEIFAMVWPMVAAREGHSHAHHSVERGQRAKLSMKSSDPLARYLAYSAQILDVPTPDYFARPDDPGGVRIDALCEGDEGKRRVFPTVLAARDTLRDQSEEGLKFRAAAAICRVRPGHILAAVLPSAASLRHVFYGAAALAGIEAPPDSAAEAERLSKHLGQFLTPAQIDQLGVLAKKVLDKGDPDLKSWAHGVAYTTSRSGFLMCDSIDGAARVLTQQGDEGIAVPFKDRIRDLVAYSVSVPYLKLRRSVGLSR